MKWLPSSFAVRLGVIALLLLLSACTSPLIKPDTPVRVESLTLTSPIAWTQYGIGRSRAWTLDGPALNSLLLIDGIKDREHVFLHTRNRQMRKGEGALFRAGMTDIEAVELLADGLQTLGAENVRTVQVDPYDFAGMPGFAAQFEFQNAAGLHYRAMLVGETLADTLSYLLFYAPAEFYFERDRRSVESIFRSIRR